MSITDVVMKAKQEKDKKAEIEAAAAKTAAKMLDTKYHNLCNAVNRSLSALSKMECIKRSGNTIAVNGYHFTVKVELVTGTCRCADDAPEEHYTDYVVRWYDWNGNCYGGNSRVEDFEEEFGKHVALYL